MTSPPGLDLEALAANLAPLVGGLAGALRGEVIAGGRSNLTYIVDDGERRFVVRRPPLAHVLPTAHDMGREYRVLAALQDTGIPVPRVIALCEDDLGDRRSLLRDGVDRRTRRARCASRGVPGHARDAARDVGGVDRDAPAAPPPSTLTRSDLADFGHPDGFLARQVRRWWQQWEASKTRELPSIEALRRRLEETVPAQSASGIVHGDYRLDNVMYAPADPSRIVAVIDWEMCTVGDPLCDVGLLCVYWADDESEAAARTLHGHAITVEHGFYKRADLLRDYAAGTERDLTSLDWYIALGAYKLAIIAEGITARFLMGMTVGEGFETMGEMVPAIVESGLIALDRVDSTQGG